ncbi:MAG: prepilin peptidase [Burkholderiaceae bacterium]|nr:prepilin peptidase [Burkholderiaceae bacterium]MCD8564628.1 prepilin peptidase [Burkholderiaceae bacterium]
MIVDLLAPILMASVLGLLVWLTASRWALHLMPSAIAVYGSRHACPSMCWAAWWFVLWFGASVVGLMVLFAGHFLILTIWMAWLAILGLLGLIDARTGLLPNELTLLLMLSGLVWRAGMMGSWLPPEQYAWGMLLGWALPFALNVLHERLRGTLAIGEGDAKLLAGIGAWLGAHDLALVWIVAGVAVLVYTVLVKVFGVIRRPYVTFGPFLAMGASVAMLLNHV